MHRQLGVMTLTVGMYMAVVSCTAPTTSPEAAAAFCTDVKVVQSAVNDINNLPPTASKDDIKAAAIKVENAYQQAGKSAQNVKTVDVNEVRNAYDIYLQNLHEVATYSEPTTFQQKVASFKIQTA